MSAHQLITEHLDLWTQAVTQKSTAGRGRSGKTELTGIKKLRELILELAVRGKLVGQVYMDEPSKDLLHRVAEEKSEFIVAGKLKKQAALSPIGDSDTPYSLPENWTWTRLGNYGADIHYGYTASADEHLSEYRLLRITDIQNDKVNWETVPGCEISKQQAEPYLLSENDILIARTGGTIGKSFLVQDINVNAVFASYLIRLKKLEATYARYVKVFLGSHTYWSQLYEASMGTGQPNVNGKSLKNLLFPVPPIEEQHRIVQKVDELMALCDRLEQHTSDQLDAHENLVDTLLGTLAKSANATELADNWARLAEHFDTLFTTEQSIDKLKQTILQLAVMGRLVEQDAGDEPASMLLTKIADKKMSLFQAGTIKKPKHSPPIKEDEKYFDLPVGWVWARFGQTGYTRLGKMLDKAKNSGAEKPYLRNTNVQWWSIDVEDIKTFKLENHELNEYRLEDGDLLICEGGEPGRCVVWRHINMEMYFQKAIHRHRTLDLCSPDYLKICLTVDCKSGRLSQRFTGSTIKHLPGDKLMAHSCPIPPRPEQHRIVQKVDELMALCDHLKERLSQASETRCQLAGAVVEGALN